ncbi:hypothetical protein [Mesorhizobium sp. WSM3860]|uniref:hypothetical protein n=1 Tax=Mesorhizobium sp. WSM3860 TaxID=2029403 RepID=UPI001596F1AE|nr:hypothetical protein [Mesorhizobium sp. WSM3860]
MQFIVRGFLTALNWWFERKPGLQAAEVDILFRTLVLDGLSPLIGDTSIGRRAAAHRKAD